MDIIHIDKLVFGGQGLGKINGKTIFVWNALPEEDVEVKYLKDKKNFAEAVAIKIINPSADRIEPREEHYLSSSPWQIIGWLAENKWKKIMAMETLNRNGGLNFTAESLEIAYDENQYGYRNKLEFNFMALNKEISLAFFNRDGNSVFSASGSLLAKPEINKVAEQIICWINKNHLSLKSLDKLVIKSNQQGMIIAALFLKNEIKLNKYPELSVEFVGFSVYLSNGRRLKKIGQIGQEYLTDSIFDTKLDYGILSFFQVNLPLFEKVLADISLFMDNNHEVVDYYAGVGSISIPLFKKIKKCVLVDNNIEAIEFAKRNIANNHLFDYEAMCVSAERMLSLIEKNKIIILDPPRAGINENLLKILLKKTPKRIIYLSCNVSTQARDLKILKEKYKISFLKLYNFFPRTPHIESLCVLDFLPFGR